MAAIDPLPKRCRARPPSYALFQCALSARASREHALCILTSSRCLGSGSRRCPSNKLHNVLVCRVFASSLKRPYRS